MKNGKFEISDSELKNVTGGQAPVPTIAEAFGDMGNTGIGSGKTPIPDIAEVIRNMSKTGIPGNGSEAGLVLDPMQNPSNDIKLN